MDVAFQLKQTHLHFLFSFNHDTATRAHTVRRPTVRGHSNTCRTTLTFHLENPDFWLCQDERPLGLGRVPQRGHHWIRAELSQCGVQGADQKGHVRRRRSLHQGNPQRNRVSVGIIFFFFKFKPSSCYNLFKFSPT